MSASSSTSVPAARPNPSSPTSSRKAAKASASSAPSSRSANRAPADPYYGHEENSVLCASFITSLFNCPNIPTVTHPGAPTPTLAHFVAYALHRTRLPSVVTFAALLLLQRLKTRFPAARGSSGHRLFISAFMIASKVICDDTYSNQSWCIVGQKMFALKEINQMEREMCGYLEWNLNVSGQEVTEFEARVRAEHGPTASAQRVRVRADLPSAPIVQSTSSAAAYPSPETTPSSTSSRPIRPVPTPYSKRSTPAPAFPSPKSIRSAYLHPQVSPQPPALASASSSLASSPASEDCKTPSPVAVVAQPHPHSQRSASSRTSSGKRHVDIEFGFTQHSRLSAGQPLSVGGW